MNFLIFLNGESRTPFIDVSGHSGQSHRFFYDETHKCMSLDGKPVDQERFAVVAPDLIGVRGCFKVHVKCIEAPAEEQQSDDDNEKADDDTLET